MKKGQKLWTKEELMLVMNLYIKIPFGKYHQRNKDVIHLAGLIGRSPGAVARKLVNLASLDPVHRDRGVKGLDHSSALDEAVWNEFYENWDRLPYESELLLAKFEGKTIEALHHISGAELLVAGKEKERMVRVRVNQSLFRKMIVSSYNSTCCITGIADPKLLVASHILQWSMNEKNRLNPENGLLLNNLHDKAYEEGLISIRPDYTLAVSQRLKKRRKEDWVAHYFLKYENKRIKLPTKYLPSILFLEDHYKNRFIA